MPEATAGVAVRDPTTGTAFNTNIHHDAAIVYPADGALYALVILTEGIDDHDSSSRMGVEIARAVHAALRGAPDSGDR